MFSYYGSKSKVIDLYPAPKYSKIIEPFAGSARYALKYFDRDVLLIDKYEVIIRIWKWLQLASKKDILSLPSPCPGQKINRIDFDCIEAAWLMGFMIQTGVRNPKLTVSSSRDLGQRIDSDKKRISESLEKIRHWDIRQGDYKDAVNIQATWFIDPPYQFGGEHYVKNNRSIDYEELSAWCESRHGQIIVCENTKAKWMPFYPIGSQAGLVHNTTEAMWCNEFSQPVLFHLDAPKIEVAQDNFV